MSALPDPDGSPAPVGLTRRGRERWTGSRAADLDAEQVTRAWMAGYEPGPDHGYLVGRDPRTMTLAELLAIGHGPLSPMGAIRAKCLDCCAGSAHEVRLCVAIACPSWQFRTGSNPYRAGKTPAQLEAAKRALEARRLGHPVAGPGEGATTAAEGGLR